MEEYFALLLCVVYGLSPKNAIKLLDNPKLMQDQKYKDISALIRLTNLDTYIALDKIQSGKSLNEVSREMNINESTLRKRVEKVEELIEELDGLYTLGYAQREEVEPLFQKFNYTISSADDIEKRRELIRKYAGINL